MFSQNGKILKEEGYKYLDDNHAIQLSTGEVVDASMQQIVSGSITYTPEQQQAYKDRKARESKEAIKRMANKPLGRYYFVNSEQRYQDISPQTVARLIYLGTYLSYNSNMLEMQKGVPMRKSDIEKVMKLSTATFFRFWHEAIDNKYLSEDKNGRVYFHDSFRRGNITKCKNRVEYQKIYIQSVRDLYYKTPVSKHRHLGYIYQMLPFVNIEFNILCFMPDEANIDAIIPMTVDEFCGLIGVTPENRSRTIRDYINITFPVRGHQEKFCSFVTDSMDVGKMKIYVNPHILYRGSNWEKVEILGAFMTPNN